MWKTITFESNYEISDKGIVRNKETKHIKSLRLNKGGYYRVTLYPSGKTYTIHRLVAETFLRREENKNYVNHKDGNKLNNNVSNLEWVTPKENFHHALSNGLYVPKDITGHKNPMAKFSEKDIDAIRKYIAKNKTVSEISKLLNAPYERVRRVVTGYNYR